MSQVAYEDDLHEALYTPVKLEDSRWVARVWDEFQDKYPQFEYLRDVWLKTHDDGLDPISLRIPWVNFPAIYWLDEFLDSDKRVFEWGSGGSTLYLSDRAGSVVSVEHDVMWAESVRSNLNSEHVTNVEYHFIEPKSGTAEAESGFTSGRPAYAGCSFRDYVQVIETYPGESFDVVLVDGRCRPQCIAAAAERVSPGGAIILDNADYTRYAPALKMMENDLLADWTSHVFKGPGPFSRVIGWCTRVWVRHEDSALFLFDPNSLT